MKIYEVIAVKLTCDGFRAGDEVLKRYTNEDDAESFKKDWEALWQKNTDNHNCVTPCWYDYVKDLRIRTLEVETEYKR